VKIQTTNYIKKLFFFLCSWFILSTYIKLFYSTLFGIFFEELSVTGERGYRHLIKVAFLKLV